MKAKVAWRTVFDCSISLKSTMSSYPIKISYWEFKFCFRKGYSIEFLRWSYLALSPFSILSNDLVRRYWLGDKMSKTGKKKLDQEWPRIDKTSSGSIPMGGKIPGESPKKNPSRLTLLSHHKLLRCRLSRILSFSALPNHSGAATKGKRCALNILIEISSHNLSQVEKVNKRSTIKTMTINKTLHCATCSPLSTLINLSGGSQWPEMGGRLEMTFRLPQ